MKAFFQATGLAVAVSLSAMARADTASGTGTHPERVFAFNGAMPTGVTVTETGRIFINFPRWGDDVPYTVAEIKQGHLVPYPDLKTNVENAKDPAVLNELCP